ncbi:MAG TPA: type II secretion system secretin GspD [Aquabacterium sp.]|uniref:type II secretion system secretin GspD n=1 Tax=Aquabacterium sp. TaxID=1872578 RepID=UPI002E3125A5|nr:type II secretion system secretin GspD [Aquabacterium sp.]HEX5354980.1 type II secretion system secretin GspD [Aquabacterium sp.]
MKTHPKLTRPRATALIVAMALTFGPGGLLPIGMAVAATAAPKKVPAGPMVTLNFVNAEIEGVARAMSAIINRQILVDPRVKGAITLYSDQPLTAREAYLNFLAALRGQGFSLVEVAGLLKVVPEAEAKLQTGTVEVGAVKQSGDQVLTQIFRIQYENANNLVTVLRPLISPNNTINANASTNTLVITDYADNLKRIGQMIAALDVPMATDMEAIPLQYAIAADLAPVVQKLADGGGQTPGALAAAGGQTTMVLSDSRTNTLMVRAPNAARMTLVRNLIQRLDRPGTAGLGGSGIHVVYLKNADAVKLAQVLRAAFPGAGGSGGGASGGSSTTGSGASGMPTSSMGGAQNTASSGGASQQSTAPVAASAGPSTGGFIQADPSTNSLIITATDALYKQLRAVIDQLDGRRAQIYVEAMIVQVDESKLAQVGFQWAAAAGNNNVIGAGTSLATGTSESKIPGLFGVTSKSAIQGLSGFNVGFLHKMADGTYNLGALASFLEQNADGNVLSKPNMVALDNEEAKIVVGQNVPFVTGQYTNGATSSSGSVNPFTTVERKDVGLTLRVRPQVGEGGTVRLTVFQENSSVDASSKSSSSGLTTNKSAIETTVVVDDGQTLVLGGLLSDSYNDGDTKVPVLGDIPILGNLFKSRAREHSKKNLMVFLRPVVMRTQDDSNNLTMDRYEYMRQRQVASQPEKSSVLPVNEAPLMDPLKLSNKLSMPPVRQPLDDPNAPAPTVVMPADSGYAPKLVPQPSSGK